MYKKQIFEFLIYRKIKKKKKIFEEKSDFFLIFCKFLD